MYKTPSFGYIITYIALFLSFDNCVILKNDNCIT